MSRRLFWGVFIGIVLCASALRVWQLGSIPVSVYWDEAAMMVDIKSVLTTGLDAHGRPWYQLIYPSYGDYKLPVYIWAATASSALFGLNEFALRLPSAVAGVWTVVIVGLLARTLLTVSTTKKYSKNFLELVQLSTMIVVTFSPWSIMFSRTGFEGHIGQALLATSVFLITLGLKESKKLFFLAGAVVGAFATYSYYSVRFVWVAVFLGLVLVYLWEHVFSRQESLAKRFKAAQPILLSSILTLVTFVLVLLPLLRSPLAKDADTFRLGTDSVLNNDHYPIQSNTYRQLAGNTPVDRIFYHRYWLMVRELLKNYSDNSSPEFLFLTGDPNLRHGTGQFGLFLLLFAPALLTGTILLGKRHPTLGIFLFGWWMVSLLPASVPENTPHALRSLNALAPLSIAMGIGGSWWWSFIKRPVLRCLLIGVLLISFSQFWWFYTTIYPRVSAHDWQSGYKPLAHALFERTSQGETVYIQPFDDRFYLWLMIYGPYSGQDFQSWKSSNYKFSASTLPSYFEGIEFQVPEDEKLAELAAGRKVTITGETKEIQARCEAATLYKCELNVVNDEVGAPSFAIATIHLLK